MTLTSTRLLSRLGTAAALALLLASPGPARDISIPFDADNFDNPLVIDNEFFPLEVGTSFTYRAEGPDGCEWNVFSVTDQTKLITINGESVTTRVIEDLAYEDEDCGGIDPDELVEKTFDWHAQDDTGNVWYFGEETYDCEGADSCVLGDGSWEAGKDIQGTGVNAQPGIFMLASPRQGDSYYQEIYVGFAEDQALVKGTNSAVRLSFDDAFPPGEWDECIVTKEWTTLSPGSVEQKYYCSGVGLVKVVEHHGKNLTFELIDPDFASETGDAFRFRKPPSN
ncbi:MAG TPA: hypothetical protein VNJ05_09595 [Sphingomicrobium sp.]|nr:hypothetical protein [Sphingomicrobium sp.]